MGSGAFGWLAFGWYTLPLQQEAPEDELEGVGGSVAVSPRPGGSVDPFRPGGYVDARRPGGSVKVRY